MERNKQELKALQSLDLDMKIMLSQDRIRQWVDVFGEDNVYVSFSGGKDSTCLLHLVRQLYPNVVGVYVDTGLEYPEVRDFVKKFDNIVWLKPEMNFKQVIQKYGYPFISKETSQSIHDAKMWKEKLKTNPELKMPVRAAKVYGVGIKAGSQWDCSRWNFMVDSPFMVGSGCCDIMKKKPIHKFEKETGKKGITGMMAAESKLRETNWIRYGCNAFDSKVPRSNPLSLWTEQDVLHYLKRYNLEIPSVYGDIVEDWDGDECTGQTSFGIENVKLKTTGCSRTGCMFCLYGSHLEKFPNRFERMKVTHPTQYKYIMKPIEDGGLGYKQVIDWFNERSKRKIRY